MLLKPGDEIDIWIVDRPLGQGGMGSVYRCHNREAKRILAAVKVLDSSLGRLPRAKARFVREAEILHGLDHPNIVKVRNVRMDFDIPYLEMEFIDGINLESRIQQGPMSAAQALPLFKQVASALAHLHPRGIRHRDVKPSNLVVQADGVVKLVDFGIAMEADGVTLTEQGQTFGSVSYAPPEWLSPDTLDPVRWDIYATGVVYYEVLTGKQAFPMAGAGTMQQQVVRMIAIKQRHPPLDPGPGSPRALRALIRDMTQPQSGSRIGTMAEVRARLEAVDLEDLDTAASPAVRDIPTWYPEAPAGETMVPGFDPFAPPADPPPSQGPGQTAPVGPKAPLPRTRLPWMIGVGAVALLALAAAALPSLLSPPDTREVRLSVAGLDPTAPLTLTLAGRPATGQPPIFVFREVPAGEAELVAIYGPPGTSCEGAAPWCVRQVSGVPVQRSREPLPWNITLRPPADRVVTFTVAALPSTAHVSATVGPQTAVGTTAAVDISLRPGLHTATVSCEVCTPWTGEVTVPAAEGPLRIDVPLVAAAPPPVAEPRKRPEPSRRGGRITNGAFAKWLDKHPDWAPTAARASGRADARYLSRWAGDAPPAGEQDTPVTDVSWAAADAFCAGRGGLAALDAPPLSWSQSVPWIEFRVSEGTPAWRRNDGGQSLAVKRSDTAALSAFRCAR